MKKILTIYWDELKGTIIKENGRLNSTELLDLREDLLIFCSKLYDENMDKLCNAKTNNVDKGND